ncbi:MAG: S53 family peptidase [Candidatus Korobacteraceae bacterium]|jgi:subtilase family serine protease
MKRLFGSSIGGLALLVASLPLLAQMPEAPAGYAHTNVVVNPDRPTESGPTGILPVEFKAAYGFNQIPNLGRGMTIALVDAYIDPNITSDLAFYASYFHLQPCNFQVVELGTAYGGNWDLEESLDVEQACALAPQANIVLVEAASNSNPDLFNAVAVAVAPPYNANLVSMSWGSSEFSGEAAYDSYLCNITNGNGQPVTFVAATGDSGHDTYYPSTSPCVVAAGGTTLVLSTATPLPNPLQLNYGAESAWRYGSGGISTEEAEPSWQVTACAQFQPNGLRCVPDVASDASASPGIPVYDTYSYAGWLQVGGTSIASPDWASFFTLVNSARVLAGKPVLSQAAQDLYNIYYSNNYNTDFHDITMGNNGSCGLDCNAVIGYDLATGIGSYKANNLFAPLVADPN